MRSHLTWKAIRVIYDYVDSALWALLVAVVIYMSVFVVPSVPKIRAEMERARAQEIAAENSYYCEKLGMQSGTQKYSECLFDLGELRLKVERRINEENEF
jgi:hypothetical protein